MERVPNKSEYVFPASNGAYVYLSTAVRDALSDRVDLYGSKDGKTLALVDNPEGQIEVTTMLDGSRSRRIVCSRALADCLRRFQQNHRGRIPAQADNCFGALLMGELEPETVFEKEDFVFLNIKNAHRMSYELTSDALCFKTLMPTRTEVLQNGEMLAFIKYSDGSVVLEGDAKMRAVRKPVVVAFAKEYWQGKRLYYRELDGAKVLSPDIRALIELQDLDGFTDLRFEQPLTLELKRSFLMQTSPPVAEALGRALSVYSCGPYLALTSGSDGEIHIEDDNNIRCQSLAQLITVGYTGILRLYLVPHGRLLVLSAEPSPDTSGWPPPDFFCRLLMSREKAPHLMKYGVYRTPAAAGTT